jgi:hypothetical protein
MVDTQQVWEINDMQAIIRLSEEKHLYITH